MPGHIITAVAAGLELLLLYCELLPQFHPFQIVREPGKQTINKASKQLDTTVSM